VIDAPRWAETARFNLQAKAAATSAEVTLRQLRLMMQVMLEDRFQLKTHRDTRELPVYDLATTKGGIKMKLASDQTPTDAGADSMLQQYLDRPIVNSSGATGLYDVQLEFGFTSTQPPTPDEPVGASIFTAVQEQLGLKLDAVKRQVEVLVIERAEHPAAD
jgi:hypothetical protein